MNNEQRSFAMRTDDSTPVVATTPDTHNTLNRVLAILERSFLNYLCYARPYVPPGREQVMRSIEQMVAAQDALAKRVAEYILASGGRPDPGDFPIEFTDTHDLSIDFLIQQAIVYQKQDITDLQQCVEALRSALTAQTLATEALGMAKGHLETLQEIAAPNHGATSLLARSPLANDQSAAKQTDGSPQHHQDPKQLAGEPGPRR